MYVKLDHFLVRIDKRVALCFPLRTYYIGRNENGTILMTGLNMLAYRILIRIRGLRTS